MGAGWHGKGGASVQPSAPCVPRNTHRKFDCRLSGRPGFVSLSGLGHPLRALGAALGDRLCFEPAGPRVANISLIRAGTEAAVEAPASLETAGARSADATAGAEQQTGTSPS